MIKFSIPNFYISVHIVAHPSSCFLFYTVLLDVLLVTASLFTMPSKPSSTTNMEIVYESA